LDCDPFTFLTTYVPKLTSISRFPVWFQTSIPRKQNDTHLLFILFSILCKTSRPIQVLTLDRPDWPPPGPVHYVTTITREGQFPGLNMEQHIANYPYKPLIAPYYIRIIVLEDGDINDPIRCRLITLDLRSSRVKYSALSYTRGDGTDRRDVFCEGLKLSITANLHSPLLRLRQTGGRCMYQPVSGDILAS
jgi:hypothetical protein